MKKAAKAVLVLPLLLVSVSGCQRPKTERAQEEQTAAETIPDSIRLSERVMAEAGIRTFKVQPMSLPHVLVLNGNVGYNENRLLSLAANVKGRVVEIAVDLGQRVSPGDPVLRLESVELGRAREELVRALAELAVAERALQRARALAEAKAIATGELHAREGEYLVKKAAAEAAERTLHLYGDSQETVDRLRQSVNSHDPAPSLSGAALLTLSAPFSGRVIDRKVTPGSLFEALQPLITIADLSSVWVFLQAYEKDLAFLLEGLPVTVEAEAFPQETFAGKVDFVGSVVDPATRTVRVRATVPNPEEKLRPGMFVTARVVVPHAGSENTLKLVVPQGALQTMDSQPVVFVHLGGGLFVRRAVTVGHSFDGFTEVLSGLAAGEEVVSEGSFLLKSEFSREALVGED
ncbi:Cobalt-zinc-cadmium resistance protein CzcB [bacterium HR09]|nr:Cobalt-zinc-cadmium resistance protein CzcB [bacterium HR09]